MRFGTRFLIFQSIAIVSAALAVEYGAQFGRSLVLTRLLGPTEFGIASSMAILAALVDMSTGLGADRYLVQARDGGEREALAVAHALTLASGLMSATLLAVLAWPTAALLGIPWASGGFFCLALMPVLRGFQHLGVQQMQRRHVFWPSAAVSVSVSLAGLAVVACAAAVLRDHRAILWGLGGQAAMLIVASRLLAQQPYRVSLAADATRRALHFGMPLMLNGLALAALGQFDRIAVGSFLGVAELGRYTLAVMTFYLPTSLLFRIGGSVAQPRLSAAWHASPRGEFPRLFRTMNVLGAAVAALAATAVTSLGNDLLAAVFGPAFAVGDVFFAIFGLAVFMRVAKNCANIGGLSIGRTRDLMLSNVSGALGLGVTVLGLVMVPGLSVAAVGMLAGEALGTAVAFARLDRHLHVDRGASYTPFLLALPIPVAAAIWQVLAQPPLLVREAVLAVVVLAVGLGLNLLYLGTRPQPARQG